MPIRPPNFWRAGVVLALAAVGASAGTAGPEAYGLLPGATLVNAGRIVVVERAEEQVLLVAFTLNGMTIADSLPVYPIPGGALVPLGEFCRILQLAIEVDPAQGRATGWFIDPKRTFAFDALTGTVTLKGAARTADPRRFEIQPRDIFVDASLLAEWFPVDLKLDLRRAFLHATSLEPLPVQAFWERSARIRKETGNARLALEQERKAYLPAPNDYLLAEVPAIDQTLRVGQRSLGDSRTSVQSTTLTTGDLLGLEHQAYLSLTNQGAKHRDLRFSLGRKDPGAELLGPLRATQFQVGDVTSQGLDLVLSGAYARGFQVSNIPLALDLQFDRRSFRGNLPPGWQVELYHNSALLSIQSVRPDGTYEFIDTPVFFGPNEYKLVFYGPLGERREETYRTDVNAVQVPEGSFRYQVMGQDPDLNGRRAMVQADYGLTPQLSLGLAAASLGAQPGAGGDGGHHNYTALNLRTAFNRLASQFVVARMETGRTAGQLSLQSGYGFSTFQFRHAQLEEGFTSDFFRAGGVRQSSDLSANLFGFTKGPFSSLSSAFGARRDRYSDARTTDTWYNRTSMLIKGLYFSNEFNWTRQEGGLEASARHRTAGNLSVSRALRGFGLRGSVGYALSAPREITQFTCAGDLHLPDAYLSLQVARDLGSTPVPGAVFTSAPGGTTATLSYQRLFSVLSLGADLAYRTSSGWQANLTLRTTFRREPRKGSWSLSSRPATGTGAISALAFVDTNGNGARDPGEPVKEGVGFRVNGFSHPAKTDAQGVAHIVDVPVNTYAFIKVDNGSMEDPLWKGQHPGFRFASRSGHAARIELPVVALGELDGTVFTLDGGKRREVAGLLVELLDATGKAVRQVRSAFDGYFIFQDLQPGSYTLRLHPEDALKRGAVAGAARRVELKPTGTQLDGQDLEAALLPAPKPIPEMPDLPAPTVPK